MENDFYLSVQVWAVGMVLAIIVSAWLDNIAVQVSTSGVYNVYLSNAFAFFCSCSYVFFMFLCELL